MQAKQKQYAQATEIDQVELDKDVFGYPTHGLPVDMIERLAKYKENIRIPLLPSSPALYRGLKADKAALIIDTSTRRIVSSAVNDFVDSSPLWDSYPNRMSSMHCSNSRNSAEIYGKVYQVFPLDNPTIGVCPKDDFWNSFGNSLRFSVDDTNMAFGEFKDEFASLAINDDTDIHGSSIREIANRLDGFLNEYYATDPRAPENRDRYRKVREALNNSERFDGLFNIKHRASRKSLIGQIENVMRPDVNGFALEKQNTIRDSDRECWFEGKAILIREHYAAKFIEMMNQS